MTRSDLRDKVPWYHELLIANHDRSGNPMGSVLSMSVVLIGLVLAAFVAVAQVKKRLVRPDDPASTGFTLADLRALHREGKMTDAEFEKAKQVIVVAAGKVTRRSPRGADTVPSEKRIGGPTP